MRAELDDFFRPVYVLEPRNIVLCRDTNTMGGTKEYTVQDYTFVEAIGATRRDAHLYEMWVSNRPIRLAVDVDLLYRRCVTATDRRDGETPAHKPADFDACVERVATQATAFLREVLTAWGVQPTTAYVSTSSAWASAKSAWKISLHVVQHTALPFRDVTDVIRIMQWVKNHYVNFESVQATYPDLYEWDFDAQTRGCSIIDFSMYSLNHSFRILYQSKGGDASRRILRPLYAEQDNILDHLAMIVGPNAPTEFARLQPPATAMEVIVPPRPVLRHPPRPGAAPAPRPAASRDICDPTLTFAAEDPAAHPGDFPSPLVRLSNESADRLLWWVPNRSPANTHDHMFRFKLSAAHWQAGGTLVWWLEWCRRNASKGHDGAWIAKMCKMWRQHAKGDAATPSEAQKAKGLRKLRWLVRRAHAARFTEQAVLRECAKVITDFPAACRRVGLEYETVHVRELPVFELETRSHLVKMGMGMGKTYWFLRRMRKLMPLCDAAHRPIRILVLGTRQTYCAHLVEELEKAMKEVSEETQRPVQPVSLYSLVPRGELFEKNVLVCELESVHKMCDAVRAPSGGVSLAEQFPYDIVFYDESETLTTQMFSRTTEGHRRQTWETLTELAVHARWFFACDAMCQSNSTAFFAHVLNEKRRRGLDTSYRAVYNTYNLLRASDNVHTVYHIPRELRLALMKHHFSREDKERIYSTYASKRNLHAEHETIVSWSVTIRGNRLNIAPLTADADRKLREALAKGGKVVWNSFDGVFATTVYMLGNSAETEEYCVIFAEITGNGVLVRESLQCMRRLRYPKLKRFYVTIEDPQPTGKCVKKDGSVERYIIERGGDDPAFKLLAAGAQGLADIPTMFANMQARLAEVRAALPGVEEASPLEKYMVLMAEVERKMSRLMPRALFDIYAEEQLGFVMPEGTLPEDIDPATITAELPAPLPEDMFWLDDAVVDDQLQDPEARSLYEHAAAKPVGERDPEERKLTKRVDFRLLFPPSTPSRHVVAADHCREDLAPHLGAEKTSRVSFSYPLIKAMYNLCEHRDDWRRRLVTNRQAEMLGSAVLEERESQRLEQDVHATGASVVLGRLRWVEGCCRRLGWRNSWDPAHCDADTWQGVLRHYAADHARIRVLFGLRAVSTREPLKRIQTMIIAAFKEWSGVCIVPEYRKRRVGSQCHTEIVSYSTRPPTFPMAPAQTEEVKKAFLDALSRTNPDDDDVVPVTLSATQPWPTGFPIPIADYLLPKDQVAAVRSAVTQGHWNVLNVRNVAPPPAPAPRVRVFSNAFSLDARIEREPLTKRSRPSASSSLL